MFDDSNETERSYWGNCFVSYQNRIDRAFIKMKSQNQKPPKTTLQRFPYPSVTVDAFLSEIAVNLGPLFVVFAFFYTTTTIIKVSG